ncbi:MAG: hypothetical protein VKJ64_14335, partial [Leptolyngbyaceae bacterium]|nr:hypothetical protein [Leptolyngbyaceae bacterium]
HPNPSPRAGEGLSTQEPGLKSLLPLWEKGFRDEGKSFVSQSGHTLAKSLHIHVTGIMATNTLSIWATSSMQIRLVEVRDTGHITINDRHFALKAGATVDITASLREGTNIMTLVVNTDSIKDDPSRLLTGKYEWLGRFEIYVDGEPAGSYSKRGTYLIGGKENTIATIEVDVTRDVSKPTVMQLVNQLQKVQGMTDANKADFSKAHPHIVFRNGITIYTWKNYVGVDHVFIADQSGKCVYGGYVGWIHSKYLQSVLQTLQQELEEYIA